MDFKSLKMDFQRNATHNIRHEKRATDKNWEKNWNNVLLRV